MSGRTAKALRKVFKAREYPEQFKKFKKDLRHSDPLVKKKSRQLARDIVRSGKPVGFRKVDYERYQ